MQLQTLLTTTLLLASTTLAGPLVTSSSSKTTTTTTPKLDHYYPGSQEYDHPSQPAIYTLQSFKGVSTQVGHKNVCYNSGGVLLGSIVSVFVPRHFGCKTYVLPGCSGDFQDWVGDIGNVRVERLVGSYIGSIQCRAML